MTLYIIVALALTVMGMALTVTSPVAAERADGSGLILFALAAIAHLGGGAAGSSG